MLEVSNVSNAVLLIKDQRLSMLKVLKVVFVAFTQHYIQSNLTHVGGVKGVLYSVYSGLSPLPGGKAISKALHLEDLVVHHQSV